MLTILRRSALTKRVPVTGRTISSSSHLPPLSLGASRLLQTPNTSAAAASAPLNGRRTMSHHAESATRPAPDKVLQDIADYVHDFQVTSELALETARLCLIDTMGCGLEGLRFPECAALMGPVVEGTTVPNGESMTYRLRSEIWTDFSLQAQRSLVPTTSSTLSGVLSTLAPRSGGWTTTTAGWQLNVSQEAVRTSLRSRAPLNRGSPI